MVHWARVGRRARRTERALSAPTGCTRTTYESRAWARQCGACAACLAWRTMTQDRRCGDVDAVRVSPSHAGLGEGTTWEPRVSQASVITGTDAKEADGWWRASRSGVLTDFGSWSSATSRANTAGWFWPGSARRSSRSSRLAVPGPDRWLPFSTTSPIPRESLFFWNYNRGKRSVVLDIGTEADRERLRGLLSGADVFLQSGRPGELAEWGLAPEPLMRDFPSLVVARITPFGDDGPWAEYAASDLVHLALGGVMDNCGYDPDPSGVYDVAPIAPQFWHAYHIAGDQLAAGIVAALVYRLRTGRGQYVSCAVHEAVSKNTELDVPSWIMRRLRFGRQTCQHAAEIAYRIPVIAATKDGRWIMTRWSDDPALRKFLETYGMAGDLEKFDAPPPEAGAPQSLGRAIPGIPIDGSLSDAQLHRMGIVSRFVGAYTYDKFPWRAAQKAGLMFAPLRKPHENALDEHWLARETFTDIEHPDIGRSVRYPTSRWISTARPWVGRRRAPHLGEDGAQILDRYPARHPGRQGSDPAPKDSMKIGSPRAASPSPSTAYASSTSPGSWPRPAELGSSAPTAQRRSRSSGRPIPTPDSEPRRRSAAERPVMLPRDRFRACSTRPWAASSTTRTPASGASR